MHNTELTRLFFFFDCATSMQSLSSSTVLGLVPPIVDHQGIASHSLEYTEWFLK